MMEPMELDGRVVDVENTRIEGVATGVDAKRDVVVGRDSNVTIYVTQVHTPAPQVDPVKCFRIVAPPIHTFEGRQELLAEVHKSLQDCLRQKHYMKRIVALVGIGGMGKTETARKLAEDYKSFYENVAWIDSETETSTKESFRELAQELRLNISQVEEGKQLAKIVYRHVLKHDYKNPLFVFDNVNGLHSDGNVFGIFNFLPTDRTGNLPLILITSQTSEWRRLDCTVVQVGELSKAESLEILYSRFKLKPEELSAKKGLSTLIEQLNDKLEGYPLALGLAAANISYLPAQDSLSLLKQNIKDYIQRVGSTEFFEQRVDMNLATDYPRSLLKVWSIAMNNVERGSHAREARHLLWILAVCPQEHLKRQKVARMYTERYEALGMTFPNESDVTFEAAMHGLQRFGLARVQENMIKIHRFIQNLSRQGDESFFGVRKLLLFFDLQLTPWDDTFYELLLLPGDCIPTWALQNEPTALLWLHSLKGVSPGTLVRFLQKNAGSLDQLLQFPNGASLTEIAKFHLTVYSNVGLEPALTDIAYSWTVFQNAVQLKISLNPSSVEVGVILELLLLFTVDKFLCLIFEAMTLKSYEPVHDDLPHDVFALLRQWLSEFDYSTAAHASVPYYLFDNLMTSLVEHFNLLQKSSLLYREGIQVISSKMLFRLADARLQICSGTDEWGVSLELIEQLREIWDVGEAENLIKNYQLLDHLARALTTDEPDDAICLLRHVVLGTDHALYDSELGNLMRSIEVSELWTLSQPSHPSPVTVDCDKLSPRVMERFEGIQGGHYLETGTWSQHVLNIYSLAVTCIAISLRKLVDCKSVSQNLLELLPLGKYEHMEMVMDAVHLVEKAVYHRNFLRRGYQPLLWTQAELADHKDILQRAIQEDSSGTVVALMRKLGKFNRDLYNCTPSPEQLVEFDMDVFQGISSSESETTSDDDTDTYSSDQSASS